MSPLHAFVVCCFVMFFTEVQAKLFRCTGPNGAISFTDKPCPGEKQEEVDQTYKVNILPRAIAPTTPPPTETKNAEPRVSDTATTSIQPKAPSPTERPLDELLAGKCVDAYRPHLAYPRGVLIEGQKLERSLSEMLITVNVRTITNPATPTRIDPIFLHEKFICVTDFKNGLNIRNTSIYVDRHKRGEQLK